MTYNPLIPQPTDDMSDSQGDLLTNFGQLNTVYSEDHVAFDASADKGKHKKVSFVSQGNDPDVDSPETGVNELVMFALEDGTDTELYIRKENNGSVNQITRDGELYLGVHPEFAINLTDLTPNSNTTAGAYNFTVNNSFNLDTANTRRVTANRCHYRFYFTNTILDSSGNPTNKYMYQANGFRNSSNVVIGKTPNTNNYNSVVDPTFIEIVFVRQSNSTVDSLTGATIMVWRVQ